MKQHMIDTNWLMPLSSYMLSCCNLALSTERFFHEDWIDHKLTARLYNGSWGFCDGMPAYQHKSVGFYSFFG